MKKYLLLLISFSFLYAQDPFNEKHSPYLNADKKYFVSYKDDGINLIKSPLKWKTKEWMIFGGVAAAGAILYNYDSKISKVFDGKKSSGFDKIMTVSETFGNGKYMLPVLAGSYAVGSVIEDNRLKAAALLAYKSFLFSGLVTSAVKFSTGRNRPFTGNPYNTFDGFSMSNKYHSFPSGHTTTAFSIASAFAEVYKDKPAVVFTSYALATLCGVQRIYDNQHWASDVFFGAVLGISVTKFLSTDLYGVNITPSISQDTYGLGFNFKF